MPRFTRVKLGNLSETRRMTRLGKIRLGIKERHAQSGNEFPRETDYFVVEPEIAKKLGYADRPEALKELEVMLASESLDENFPVALKAYRASGLFCEGDGEVAQRFDQNAPGRWVKRKCPCELYESGECKEVAVLSVVLPSISLGGVFHIVTSSKNSIIDVQSGIDHVRRLIGRVSWVPLKLERVANVTSHVDGKGQRRQQTHYTLRLTFPYNAEFVNQLRAESERILTGPRYVLPEPDQSANPFTDPADVVVDETAAGERVRDADARVVGTAPTPPAPAPATAKPTPPAPPPPPPPPERKSAPSSGGGGKRKSPLAPAWRLAKSVYGDRATEFWNFLVTDYFGAETSDVVSAEAAKPVVDQLRVLSKLPDGQRAEDGETYWSDLQVDVAERAATASER